jgi:hypothetical protein
MHGRMKPFRARAVAVLLFGLLTLGQAYPFASAWAMGRKAHPCCCASEIAKPCDCDHGSSKKKKFSCHSEAKTVGISPAPCGAKTESASLNFRGETCLPRFAGSSITAFEALHVDDLSVRLPKFSAVPEPPPPRV